MKNLILGVAFFSTLSAFGDLRALDEAELKELGKVAAQQLKTCPELKKANPLQEPEVSNKTSEHLDKALFRNELKTALGSDAQWAEAGTPLKVAISSQQQDSGSSLTTTYKVKLHLGAECRKTVKLKKALSVQ